MVWCIYIFNPYWSWHNALEEVSGLKSFSYIKIWAWFKYEMMLCEKRVFLIWFYLREVFFQNFPFPIICFTSLTLNALRPLEYSWHALLDYSPQSSVTSALIATCCGQYCWNIILSYKNSIDYLSYLSYYSSYNFVILVIDFQF